MKNTSGKTRPPQISLVLRVCCGGYLLYLAWSLRGAALAGERQLFFGGAAILFVLAGAALCFYSIRALARGEFRRPYETDEGENEDAFSEKGDGKNGHN